MKTIELFRFDMHIEPHNTFQYKCLFPVLVPCKSHFHIQKKNSINKLSIFQLDFMICCEFVS